MRAHSCAHASCLAVTTSAAIAWAGIACKAEAAETTDPTMGFAEVLRLDRAAHTIANGNPEVVDATIGGAQTVVLAAKPSALIGGSIR